MTERQLTNFFKKYRDYKKVSDRCALDGRYFWKVLSPYPGVAASELYIRINDLGTGRVVISDPIWDPRDISAQAKKHRYIFIKAIIDLSNDPTNNQGSVHSNLIYFDRKKKEVVRFEPMLEQDYTSLIDQKLQAYFAEITPTYAYRMRPDHPQLPITETCPRKGMCAAYTLKAAMMLINGMEKLMDGDRDEEEKKILRFASAIQEEYGDFENYMAEDEEYQGNDRYQSSSINMSSSMGRQIYQAGVFFDLENPGYTPITPESQPGLDMYSASYYGYVYGPRYKRADGWGWGRNRWVAYGRPEWGCGCGRRKKIPPPRY